MLTIEEPHALDREQIPAALAEVMGHSTLHAPREGPEPVWPTDRRAFFHLEDGRTLVVSAAGWVTARRLAHEIADATGGAMRHPTAQRLVGQAVEDAVLRDVAFVASRLSSLVAQSLVPFLVVAEFRDNVRGRDITIGTCTISHAGHDLPGETTLTVVGLTPPTIATSVRALDDEAARVAAREAFGEARAILAVADGRPWKVGPRAVVVQQPSGGVGTATSSDQLNSWPAVNEAPYRRELVPGFHELSLAAAKPIASRTDWEGRTLAAARWYHRASTTAWYSEAVAAAISALEVLLLDPHEPDEDGPSNLSMLRRRIKQTMGVFDHFSNHGEQKRWLHARYTDRNNALHGGHPPVSDLEVERLLSIVSYACRWALWHLNPFHRAPEYSCASLDEILVCSQD